MQAGTGGSEKNGEIGEIGVFGGRDSVWKGVKNWQVCRIVTILILALYNFNVNC
jgi:hypothetical protein